MTGISNAYAIPYPTATDSWCDTPAQLQAIAESVENVLSFFTSEARRLSAVPYGRVLLSTDNAALPNVSNGSQTYFVVPWDTVDIDVTGTVVDIEFAAGQWPLLAQNFMYKLGGMAEVVAGGGGALGTLQYINFTLGVTTESDTRDQAVNQRVTPSMEYPLFAQGPTTMNQNWGMSVYYQNPTRSSVGVYHGGGTHMALFWISDNQ